MRRARRLGTLAAGPAAEGAAHLVFRVAEQEYALPLLGVRQIVSLERVRSVREAPKALRGVLDFDGRRVPILELAVAFGRRALRAPEQCALIVPACHDGGESLVGLSVDGVSRVAAVPSDAIAPAPRMPGLQRHELIACVALAEGTLLPILGVPQVLAHAELAAALAASTGAR